MSDTVMIECSWCQGAGRYQDHLVFGGAWVVCTDCWGSGRVEYTPNCDHLDAMWDGYGDVDDPQWDGANQCDMCGALFTLLPRETR